MRIIGTVQEIVDRYLMKIGQTDENRGGDVDIPAFVVAVDALAARQKLADLGLCEILVFSQLTDSLVQGDPSISTYLIFYVIRAGYLAFYFSEKFAKIKWTYGHRQTKK